jgi:hypothetical protein
MGAALKLPPFMRIVLAALVRDEFVDGRCVCVSESRLRFRLRPRYCRCLQPPPSGPPATSGHPRQHRKGGRPRRVKGQYRPRLHRRSGQGQTPAISRLRNTNSIFLRNSDSTSHSQFGVATSRSQIMVAGSVLRGPAAHATHHCATCADSARRGPLRRPMHPASQWLDTAFQSGPRYGDSGRVGRRFFGGSRSGE